MFKFTSSPTSIGLERTPSGIKGACVAASRKGPRLVRLFELQAELNDKTGWNKHHPIVTTGLEGREVLVRSLHLPLTREKDIEEALAFQAEPLLPYAPDQALLAYQVVAKTAEGTDLTLLTVRKEALQAHLELWKAWHLDPEKVACVPSALCEFAGLYLAPVKTCLILHLHEQEMVCVLIKDGKLCASFAQPEGFNLLLENQSKEGTNDLPSNQEEWQAIEHHPRPSLVEAFKRLQKESTRMGYALTKECKSDAIEGIVVTGDVAKWEGFSQTLIQNLPFPLLTCQSSPHYSAQDLLRAAVPIGLALGSLPGRSHSINFRQQEWSYPHPYRRLMAPLALYFVAVLSVTASFYFFGQQYLQNQALQLKQNYIDLLAARNKSHGDFEVAFATKNSKKRDSFADQVPALEQLKTEDMALRLAFLQKELQATPDSFPLFANIPRVSDFLAWLSQHPAAMMVDEKGSRQAKLQIDSFAYTMLKRPQQGKKQEKYQVKVELEFSSPTPKWAREFHDALITPNDWIDSKGEVKWSSNRGKYKTSFFLKDKTIYPSS